MDPDGTLGYAGYKVDDSVQSHELWGGGVYCYNRNNPNIVTGNAFQVPATPGVKLHRIMTMNLSGPGVINAVVNGEGNRVDGNTKETRHSYVVEYPASIE